MDTCVIGSLMVECFGIILFMVASAIILVLVNIYEYPSPQAMF